VPLPALYSDIGSKLLGINRELRDLYSNFTFLYRKAIKLQNEKNQIEALEKILRLIPDDRDPRHIHAADEIEKIKKIASQKKS